MQTQQRTSNGAESVEAKQDRASAQQAAEKAARNEDAESVEAKEVDGSAGSDESDEEGEIAGKLDTFWPSHAHMAPQYDWTLCIICSVISLLTVAAA